MAAFRLANFPQLTPSSPHLPFQNQPTHTRLYRVEALATKEIAAQLDGGWLGSLCMHLLFELDQVYWIGVDLFLF